MNRAYIRILTIASLAAILVAAFAGPNRDERAIRRRLHALARQCEKKTGHGMLKTLSDLADLRAAFTSNALIHLGHPYPLNTSPRELASLVARAHAEVSSLEIRIQGIEFLPRAEAGVIEMLTAIALRVQGNQHTEEFVDEYRLRWRKENGVWRIESARADSAIQSPWP